MPSLTPQWRAALARVLDDPAEPTLVFQPIVDLVRGVVAGYEVLARFSGPPTVGPDRWFAVAASAGVAEQLEARVLRRAAQLRPTMPPNTFLTVNVSPQALLDPSVVGVLDGLPGLSGLFVELTEHVPFANGKLADALTRLRAAGAMVALDDAGSGYAGLRQLLLVRPDLVKLDRELVSHADGDEAKLALAMLLGEFTGRLDGWLLAEGLERLPELDAFIGLGVPLGQGYLLGRPGPTWAELPDELGEHIRAQSNKARNVEQVVSLVQLVPTVPDAAASPPAPPAGPVAAVDSAQRPTALWLPDRRGRSGARYRVPASLRVPPHAPVADVARRAMLRPEITRFDPVVCTDTLGRLVGIVRVERLVDRLAELTLPPS